MARKTIIWSERASSEFREIFKFSQNEMGIHPKRNLKMMTNITHFANSYKRIVVLTRNM